MGVPMNFQVVILAGGTSKKLFPLVSKDVPKALLPVANRPVLSYVLELLEASNLKDLIVVVAGEDAAVRVGGWISGAYDDRLHVEVAAVPDDVGTAGALRAVAHHLTADDILVVSGDLVCDVPPGAVAATHRRQEATVTALLCTPPATGPSEGGSAAGGKDKAKRPGLVNVIGLDSTGQSLLFIASGAQVEKGLRIQRSLLRTAGQMEVHSDLVDAHLYAFKRTVLQDVLEQKPKIRSIKDDLVPYLVRSQLRYGASSNNKTQTEEATNEIYALQKSDTWPSNQQIAGDPQSHPLFSLGVSGWKSDANVLKCCAYIANKSKYCARLNSIQAFGDINRDVVGEATHLTGYTVSAHNNIVHPSAQHGSKTTIGPYCMLGDGSQMGDKCSVKRSIVGRHCRIGSNVKIVNSVVMNHVTIEDGCLIQGSIVCSNVQLLERATLKDCQVGAGYIVASGTEHRGEALAKKEKA
uniref:Translation initiation factor eIF2B subunit gamma n=1 Tax=Araucaria cunninghamii TaxID=56994 RepID=A0A0D6QX99_ARACU